MRLSVTMVKSHERRSLMQKLRLRPASDCHGARFCLSLSGEDLALLPGIPRKTLEAWAGARLAPLVGELVATNRAVAMPAAIVISAPISGPEDGASLRRRTDIFAHLLRFALAERRLVVARERAAQSAPLTRQHP